MMFYVGTSGCYYPKWKGSFYPEKLPVAKMLPYYGERFRTVESNDTFRQLPPASTLERRAQFVPANFQFALKAPMQITHRRRLKDVDDLMVQLFDVVEVLRERLGPVLFQLPPNFKKDAPRLRDFLTLLPESNRVAFEFRHSSWFDEEVYALLYDHDVALCLAEVDDELDTPFIATTDWGYLRLRRSDYSDAELQAWVHRIRGQDWHDAFVFFKHEDQGHGPRLAQRFLELAGPP